MVEPPTNSAGQLTIGPSKAKLFGLAALAAAIIGGAALVLLLGPHRTSGTRLPRIVLGAAFLIMGFGIVAVFTKRAFGGTIVTLSRAGFLDRRLSDDVVPWSAITGIRVRAEHVSKYVEIVTDPAFSRTLKGSWRYRLNRTFGFPGLAVTTVDLAISLDELLAAIHAYRNDALATGSKAVGLHTPSAPEVSNGTRTHQRIPYATISLMLVLSVVFAVEVVLAPFGEGATTLTAATLAGYGGVGKAMVLDGQWWRLLSAPLLHSGPAHLVGNLVALGLGGTLLERRIGWRWFLACFGGGALAGATATCLLDDPNIVSVGASGGITGLFAAVIVIAFALESGHDRVQLLIFGLRLLLPTLIPSRAAGLAHVDIAAHVGGAIGGLVAGIVAVIAWRRESKRRSSFPFGLAAACAWVGATVLAVGLDAAAYVEPGGARMADRREPDFAALYRLFILARKGDTSAEEALKRRVSAGSNIAATFLGNLYDPTFNKASASADRTREAVRWYRIAADRDQAIAETDLGLLLVNARPGSAADPIEAARLFQRAAPLDFAAARVLGIMYQKGIGVSHDDGRALALIGDAAERGDVFAEKLLAGVYDVGGLGTVARPAEAVRMLRLAVMHGDPQAERELAEHLAKGRGTLPAPAEAAEWYARAALHGDAEAKIHLATSDPDGARRIPPWGATRQVIGRTPGDDAAAERARCLEQRFSEPPTKVARDLPASFEAQKPRSAALVREFGRDARVRYARAAAMYDADHDDIAAVDLQCAVDDHATWYAFPSIQPFILTLLARIELDRGRRDNAERIVAPVCASGPANIAALDLASLCVAQSRSKDAP